MTDARNFPTTPAHEPVWVGFIRTTVSGQDSWDIPCDSLTDAREHAEQAVNDGEADSATITHRASGIDQTYDKDGWEDQTSSIVMP